MEPLAVSTNEVRTWPIHVQDPVSLNVYTVQAKELHHEANQAEFVVDVDGLEYVRSKSQPLYWQPRAAERPEPQTLGAGDVPAPPMEPEEIAEEFSVPVTLAPVETPAEATAEDGTADLAPAPSYPDTDPED